MNILKFYLTPILTLIIAAAILMSGHWLWFGFFLTLFLMVVGDAVLGNDFSHPSERFPLLLEAPLFIALPALGMLLITLAWSAAPADFLGIGAFFTGLSGIDLLARRELNTPLDFIGAVLGVGLLVAGYGTNSAHELTHRTNKFFDYTVGRWLLSMSGNADFAIEHVFGHHVFVGTSKDPATAGRGENVYNFFLRSSVGGHVSAWRIQLGHLKKKGSGFLSVHNQMLTGYAMTGAWLVIFAVAAGAKGVALFVLQAIWAKFVLEAANYIEHYGLSRKPGEAVKPHHSWNSNRRMSLLILYSLVRHSAHHERARVPFWKLDTYPDAPEMPQGYLTTILIAMLPSLWFRVMKPRLGEWDQKYS